MNGLSLLGWDGGAVVGAAWATKHRVLGGVLGAVLIGAITDSLIERQQMGLPIAGAALTGAGLVGVTALVVHDGARGKS